MVLVLAKNSIARLISMAPSGSERAGQPYCSIFAEFIVYFAKMTHQQATATLHSVPAERPERGDYATSSGSSQLPHYFSAKEVEQLIAHVVKPVYKLFALAGWRTGARMAELLALEWRDINYVEDLVHIRHGKGGKPRLVPLHPELAGALRWQVPGHPNERVFKFSARSANNIVPAAVRSAGLTWNTDKASGPNTHSLRHSAARHWLENGVAPNKVAAWLGHSSPAVTLRVYLPLTPDTGGTMQGIP